MDDRRIGAESSASAEVEFWRPDGATPARGGALSRGVTAVICTYARPSSLGRCIASLKVQTRKPDTLLVVDASRDAESERSLFLDPTLAEAAGRVGYLRVGDRDRGLTRQRNVALSRVTDDLVAFFDDDIVLRPTCLAEMESVHRAHGDAVVGVGAVIEGQPQRPDALWRVRRALGIVTSLTPGRYCRSGMSIPWSFLRQEDGVAEGDWLPGGAVMWKTATARDVGFNEEFAGYAQGEDLDFSLRVARRGRLLMACAARLEHLHEESGRPDPFRLGYMAILNRYEVHRRGLPDRRTLDVLWFAYAWSVDSLLLLRHALFPARAAGVFRQLAGRVRAAWDLVSRGFTEPVR